MAHRGEHNPDAGERVLLMLLRFLLAALGIGGHDRRRH